MVEPHYGWGWTDGGETLEVPSSFEAVLTRRGVQWHGEVVQTGHPYHGRAVALSPRHTEWDGIVNVQLSHPNKPTIFGYAAIPIGSSL